MTPTNDSELEKQEKYNRAYDKAMANPQKGLKCNVNHGLTYYHPLLGCPLCGEYAGMQRTSIEEEIEQIKKVAFAAGEASGIAKAENTCHCDDCEYKKMWQKEEDEIAKLKNL